MGNVHDASHTKDKGKPYGQKGVNTPADQAADDDVQNQSHIPSFP
jgi:hypothetical protein